MSNEVAVLKGKTIRTMNKNNMIDLHKTARNTRRRTLILLSVRYCVSEYRNVRFFASNFVDVATNRNYFELIALRLDSSNEA